MSQQIEKSFVVRAPIESVWEFLTDPHRVAGCLPGARVTGQEDERTYTGTVKLKVGPVSASYRGRLRFESLDREAWTAAMSGRGQEERGKGGAEMTMQSRLASSGDDTEVSFVTQVNVTGILAQFGRGMIQDVSDQLFQQFSDCVRAELESGAEGQSASAPAEPPSLDVPSSMPSETPEVASVDAPPAPADREDVLDVGALGARVTRRALARFVRRPVFWIALIVLAALAVLLF